MKCYYLAIVLLFIISNTSLLPSSKHKKGNLKIKRRFKRGKSKSAKNFDNPIDIGVFIRFKFAKYGHNTIANFIAGVLDSFYGRTFAHLQKNKSSRNIVENHVQCVQKELGLALRKQRISRNFEKKFLFGGIYPNKNQFHFHEKFNKQYKTLRRRNKLLTVVKKLQKVTGTVKKKKIRKKEIETIKE